MYFNVKRNSVLALIAWLTITSAVYAVSSSASYKITSDILEQGGQSASSASYKLLGKARDRQLSVQTSASYNLNAGFLRSAYFSGVSPVLAPVVIAITPSSASNTGTVNITNLGGANFQPGATVTLSKAGQTSITATNVTVVNAGKITCSFDLTGAAGGAWDVTVANTDGRSGSLAGAFTVTLAAPTVTSISPNLGNNNAVVTINNLAGSNFRSGAAVKLTLAGQTDITATSVIVVSATQISCQFDLTNKTAGFWDVVVTNSDGQSGALTQGFNVQTPSIVVTKPLQSSQPVFNPGKGPTTLSFSLGRATDEQGNPITVTVYVYNIRGERVYQTSFLAKAGDNSVVWDGLTAFKSYLSPGVYIIQLIGQSGGHATQLSEMKLIVNQ